MKQVYIGFVNADPALLGRKEPFGWKIIRWFQRSPIVHTFMVFQDGITAPLVYETTETVYDWTTLADRASGTPLILYRIEGLAYDRALSYCVMMLDTPYDYVSLIRLGITLLIKRLTGINLRFGKSLNPPQLLYCAEAVVNALHAGGIKVEQMLGLDDPTPPKLLLFAQLSKRCILVDIKDLFP